jgi:MraZ protein
MPFLSHFEHTIDTKGRVSIPAPYRDELARQEAGQVILSPVPGDTPVLWVFPPAVWEQMVQARMAEASSPFDPKIIEFKRGIVQRSSACNLDGNGRILIPGELRSLAQLERDVVLAGMNDWFEIWSAERYAQINGGVAVDPELWEKL